jgi:[ribosomal protein S18]-alanine N-acetyltransferase
MMGKESLGNDLIIRDYKAEDFKQVSELWLQTGLGNPVRGDNAEIIKKTLEFGGKLLVMVSKHENQIIGTSWITSDGRRMLLHHFGILPDYQGKGLSKILLKESFKFVKESGMQVKLEVHSSNVKAINLYKKFGFNLLNEYCIYIIRDMSNK